MCPRPNNCKNHSLNKNRLYEDIPEHLRFKGELNLPEALPSEYALKRHVESILSKNQSCKDHLNFLGGGKNETR
jgi:glycine dehydrogenase subunit 1